MGFLAALCMNGKISQARSSVLCAVRAARDDRFLLRPSNARNSHPGVPSDCRQAVAGRASLETAKTADMQKELYEMTGFIQFFLHVALALGLGPGELADADVSTTMRLNLGAAMPGVQHERTASPLVDESAQ